MDNQFSLNSNEYDKTGKYDKESGTKMGKKKVNKNRGLDGLRGISIIIALCAILAPKVFKSGDLILQMFFVVLGYITTVTSVSLMRKDKYKVSQFYIRRIKNYYLEILVLLFAFCGLSLILSHSITRIVGKEIIKSVLGFTVFFIVFPLLFHIWNMIADKNGPTASNILLLIVALIEAITIAVSNFGLCKIYPFIVGMMAALIYKKKLKYSSLPADYKMYRTLMFIAASLIVIVGIIFLTGSNIWSRLGIILVIAAMGVMVWLATAQYLKIGGIVDLGIFKFLGKMWLEFLITFISMVIIFVYKGWTNGIGGRIILVLLILAITFGIYKAIHFINSDDIKRMIYDSEKVKDPTTKLVRLLPIVIFGIFMLMGIIGLIVSSNSSSDNKGSDKKPKEKKTVTEISTTLTTQATTEAPTTEKPKPELASPADSSKVTVIGDFMLQGISSEIVSKMPEVYIDASQNRQAAYDGVDVINSIKEQGNLRDIVVIMLGSNGEFSEETGQEIIKAAGEGKKIYWVNVYGTSLEYTDTVNSTLTMLASKNANLTIIDWHAAVEKKPEYVSDGGPFLTEEGINALAELIYKSVK